MRSPLLKPRSPGKGSPQLRPNSGKGKGKGFFNKLPPPGTRKLSQQSGSSGHSHGMLPMLNLEPPRWPVMKGWWDRPRGWNVRVKGPRLTRFAKSMAGGTVCIPDGRMPAFDETPLQEADPYGQPLYDQSKPFSSTDLGLSATGQQLRDDPLPTLPACNYVAFRVDRIEADIHFFGSELTPGPARKEMALAFGVTTTDAEECGSKALRSYDLEGSHIVGHGPYYISGDGHPRLWKRVQWDAASLRLGDKVGLMVLSDEPRDLVVFVNSRQVLRMETDLTDDEDIFLVVDLFGCVTQITLMLGAEPPKVPLKPGDRGWFDELKEDTPAASQGTSENSS